MAATRAITVPGASFGASGANLTSGNFGLPAGWLPGDLAVFVWYSRESGRTFTKPTAATEKFNTSSAGFGHLWLGYRFLVAGDTTFSWSATSSTNNTDGFFTIVFRGAASSGEPFDRTSAATPATFSNTQSPDPPALSAATQYDKEAVIAVFGKNNDYGASITAPSTYTSNTSARWEETSGTDGSSALAYLLDVNISTTSNPGAWTLGGAATDDGLQWTASIRPEVRDSFTADAIIRKTFPAWAPGGSWTLNTQGSSEFQSVAYGNGYWVAVGAAGMLYYKTGNPSSGSWTQNDQGSGNFIAVAYGGGYWVAVGLSGTRYHTTDPTGAWTSNAEGTTNLQEVAYGDGYWVTTGTSGALFYKSGDPSGAWTSNTQGSSTLGALNYGNGYWVAAGASGSLYYKATDPTGSWTSNTQGINTWNEAVYSNGYWVIVAAGGVLRYKATDPTGSWTSNDQGSSTFLSLAATDQIFVAVGNSGTVYYDTDGVPSGSWTQNNQGSPNFNGVAATTQYIVAVGTSGAVYVGTRGVAADAIVKKTVSTSVTADAVISESAGDAADPMGTMGFFGL